MIALVGDCSEKNGSGDCILDELEIEDMIEIKVADPTAGARDKISLQLFISEKMPKNIRPICLFNRGQEMDLANLVYSPYFKMRWIFEFSDEEDLSDLRDKLDPLNIVPHDICFKQSTEWEQRFGDLLQHSQRFLCVDDPEHYNDGILVNFHSGRYFLRGFSVPSISESVEHSLYLDILPQIDWIGQHAEGIFVLPAIPPSKPCRGFKNPNNLSFRNYGKKPKIRKKRDDDDYSNEDEDVDASGYILNGYNAEHVHPWHAYVENTATGELCGGTLISMRTVLTAAHCIYGRRANQFRVSIGMYDKTIRNDSTVQKRRPSQLICHPGYKDKQFKHDVGLMIFDKSFILNKNVRQICLWNEDSSLSLVAKRLGVVVGYGLKENDNVPKKLQEAKLPIRSHKECYQQHRKFFAKYLYPGDNFCAGYANGTGTCKGDSGGSLAVEKNGRWFVRGIVSFGITKKVLVDNEEESFCMPNRYSLFVDVASYMDWIVENTPDVSFKD
ncbi:coagulation factor IX-like isoform X1 [Cloeon dipterum]|uniref:coagulation factor IX-like isoform X1 n=1 Tax=Cloeon dipterum TaxID=197152 RepID=UPI00321FF43C